MKAREIVEIEFSPFVCQDCGQLQIAADLGRTSAPANCDACESDNIFRAGPAQMMHVQVFRRALPAFEKGERQ